jgi:hypothetical protein
MLPKFNIATVSEALRHFHSLRIVSAVERKGFIKMAVLANFVCAIFCHDLPGCLLTRARQPFIDLRCCIELPNLFCDFVTFPAGAQFGCQNFKPFLFFADSIFEEVQSRAALHAALPSLLDWGGSATCVLITDDSLKDGAMVIR